jgi:pimeloyl-ACP methyl ester carboxylesterase
MCITDVVNVLKYEDLRDVVLVGHSSSGAVITGVADRAPAQIAHVIYLDAFVPEDGQAVLDLITPERRQMMEALVKTEGNGWLLPRFAPPPWETIVRDMWGVTDEDDMRWMLDRLGPTPFGHLKDPVHRMNPVAEKLSRAYIRCRQSRALHREGCAYQTCVEWVAGQSPMPKAMGVMSAFPLFEKTEVTTLEDFAYRQAFHLPRRRRLPFRHQDC